jgi:hypothetical protein
MQSHDNLATHSSLSYPVTLALKFYSDRII